MITSLIFIVMAVVSITFLFYFNSYTNNDFGVIMSLLSLIISIFLCCLVPLHKDNRMYKTEIPEIAIQKENLVLVYTTSGLTIASRDPKDIEMFEKANCKMKVNYYHIRSTFGIIMEEQIEVKPLNDFLSDSP